MKHWIRKFISCILTIAIFMSAMPKQISIKLHMIKICKKQIWREKRKAEFRAMFLNSNRVSGYYY